MVAPGGGDSDADPDDTGGKAEEGDEESVNGDSDGRAKMMKLQTGTQSQKSEQFRAH